MNKRSFFNLLVTLFLFTWPVNTSATCPPPPSGTPWWQPLGDPCTLLEALQQNGTVHLGCCIRSSAMSFAHHQGDDGDGSGAACGPCSLQTYNIASACAACTAFSKAVNVVQVEDAITIGNTPTLIKWMQGDPNQNLFVDGSLPPWTAAQVDPDGTFNATEVIQVANPSMVLVPTSPSASSAVTLSTAILSSATPSLSELSTPPSTSSPSDLSSPSSTQSTPSSPSNVEKSQMLASSGRRAAIIAGGVVGGALVLALISLVVLCFIRGRRQMHIAPSAEFMPVVTPGLTTSQDEFLPQFSPSFWKDPILEKIHSAISPQRDVDAGPYTSPRAWDVEKA